MSEDAEKLIFISALFPGFRFSPTDVELISYYLRRKIGGDDNSVAVIAEVEIYKFEPWDLPGESKLKSENEWFYFCARGKNGSQSRRVTQLGYWKSTGQVRSVKSGNQIVGTKRMLVFHTGRAHRNERTEWFMHEYCIHGATQDALVVCRLKKNTDFRASSSQTPMDNGHVQDDEYVGQTGGSEMQNNSYSVYEPELHIPNGDIVESSNVVEDQADTDDDCYAEIMNDDIINLDEEVLKASLAFRPNYQQTISSEASSSRKRLECGSNKKPKQTMDVAETASFGWRIPNPFRIKKNDNQRSMTGYLATTALLAILISVFFTILTTRGDS
ncbi:hypothetical protein EUTSA_v10002040mg [Eutrema salsugineum]|uniref:NAC domain-containing protein n=1 Tax=Eutrema salsugineum TaxID=72664 RepID=V4LI10_EUTSA|nr:NAC domain-containing protein 40 [Eutrema salsugineum]ESQ50155.1 hypothetical protein EUTSA_v10002040mg [Eutrema salsugineum]